MSISKTVTAAMCAVAMLVAVVPPVAAEPSPSGFDIMLGEDAARSNPTPLDGTTVSGDIYVFVLPDDGPNRVRFYLDDPELSSKPLRNIGSSPWDLVGSDGAGNALPFDTAQLTDGAHILTAIIFFRGGVSERVDAHFEVANSTPSTELVITPDSISFEIDAGQSDTAQVEISATDAASVEFTLTTDQPWLVADPSSGESPASVSVTVDGSELDPGTHTARLTASAPGYTSATAEISVEVRAEASEPSAVRGIHTAWTQDPSTTFTVAWTQEGGVPVLEFRKVGTQAWIEVTSAVFSTFETGTMYTATATGLDPATEYEYRIVNDGSSTPASAVSTAPSAESGESFQFAYVADTGLIGRLDGLDQQTERVRDEISGVRPLLVLAGGDYAYLDTDTRFESTSAGIDAWFDQMEPLATRSILMPTYGNHELNEGYLNWSPRFPTPAGHNNRRYYSFDVGPVHFVSILAGLSSQPISSSALDWIDADMAAAREAGARWIVPFMHVSAFADGSNHPSNLALREQLGPVFERHGVEIALSSHDQSYERTYPLVDVPTSNTPTSTSLACYDRTDGVVWAKVSPGGKLSNINQGFSVFRTAPPPEWTAVRNNTHHHYAVVEADSDSLRFRAYGVPTNDGSTVVIDDFEYRETPCNPESANLVVSPVSASSSLDVGGSDEVSFDVSTSDGTPVAFSVTSDQSWLVPHATGGTTPASVAATVDASDLTPGSYSGLLTFSASGYDPADVTVSLTVSDPNSSCSSVPEEFGIVSVPFMLVFDGGDEGLCDVNSVGTGFLRVDPSSNGIGYLPENLEVQGSRLNVLTTAGLNNGSVNTLDNALSVGLFPPQETVTVATRIVDPPAGTGNFEQAGLWFGNGEDDHVKLVVQSRPQGLRFEMVVEVGGAVVSARTRAPSALATASLVDMRLRMDPVNLRAHGEYRLDNGTWNEVDTFSVPGEFFTADNATLPPGETRTFTGILASHRNGPNPVTYTFDNYTITTTAQQPPPSAGGIAFDRVEVTSGVPDPTAMVLGPDGRLYVTTVLGRLYRVTLDPVTYQATQVEAFDTLTDFYEVSCRLTLGIDVDPDSTAGNVVLWVASAADSCAISRDGPIDGGSIVRISGSNLDVVEEFVVGLPRAQENHSLNAARFGPDGRLYVAAGGTTGAGHTPETCCRGLFGNRWEQPLSAALLVMDVKDPSWDLETDGQCASGVRNEPNPIPDPGVGGPNPVPNFPNTIGELGASWTCGVEVYASGLRNMYDFVFHSNGELYGADNGLGITGTFPPETTPDCRYSNNGDSVAFGKAAPWNEGGQQPGEQPDLLHRIVAGGYYGHPNPSRGECVFMDGSFQGVAPLSNFKAPIYDLGVGRSANGIIEYSSDAFCGALKGDLLISNFSSGGDLTRVKLSSDGMTVAGVTEKPGLLTGFKNPLSLVEGPDGTIYVGEFDQAQFPGGGKITAVVPNDGGCFTDVASMPQAVLDPGSASVDGRMYVVGGKIDSGNGPTHINSLYVYDPAADQWFTGPNKGGSAVENPAVVAHDGKIYVFGGSTAPFAGFRNEVWIYTPAGTNGNQGSWTQGNSTGFTNRAGATAETLNNQIYVIGGLGCPDGSASCSGNQTSLNSVQIYNPATNSWTNGPSLTTPRDNPGSAVLNGNIYVFGGRTWGVNNTLNTVEYLTGSSWQPRASMPTGRRSLIVGTINNKAQIMGGESPLFTQNEQYDPTTNTWTSLTPMNPGRHGAAYTTINNTLYIAGGGPTAGTSYTNTATKFNLP